MKRFLVGGCAALLVAACSQDPSLYLGGPAGPVTRIQLSAGQVPMTVGQTVTVGAAALDEVGNVSPEVPTFTSCGGPITVSATSGYGSYSAAADITAAPATVGVTCVLASAGGVSDSIRIAVGPAGLRLTGPDTVFSGATSQFTPVFYDADGGEASGTVPIAWTSTNEARMITTFDGGQVTGRAPGAVTIQARAPNGVVQTRGVTILPDVFTGTLSANTGDGGLVITATRGSGDDAFDADASATVGGQAAWVEVSPPSSMLIAIPATGTAGARNLDILNLGLVQTAKRTTFTTLSTFDDIFGTTTDAPDTTVAPRFADYRTAGGYVYFTHAGFGTGGAARGIWNGGTQQDHYFQFTTGATGGSVTATLTWTNAATGADFDLEICRADGSGCRDWVSGSTTTEAGTAYTVAANTTYTVMTSCWTASNNIHNLRLRLAVSGTTIH